MIAAGGTAGHVVPALAVADALRDRGALVTFIGTADRAEAKLVPAAGYEIDHLRVRGLDRSNPLKAAGALGLALRAVPSARRILRDRTADVVVGAGGYVAAPAGVAAVSTGRPLVICEADRHLGLTNRMLAKRAAAVCLAFPIDGLDGERVEVTGRPVPAAVVSADRAAARQRFAIEDDQQCLLVVGGSQGALSINNAVLDGLLDDPGFAVIHVCGSRDYEMVLARVKAAGSPDHYHLHEYLPNLGEALAACDLVVSRSGASVFELAAARRAAILVPYPYATGRHQHSNAEWMARGGAAIVVEDDELDGPVVRNLAGEILEDPARLEAMSAASARLAMPEAAAAVAKAIVVAADGGDR